MLTEIRLTRYQGESLRWATGSLMALHTAAEAYVIGVLQDANLVAQHSERVTVCDRDIQLALRLRGDPGYVYVA